MDARLVPGKPLEQALAAKLLHLRERFDLGLVQEFQRGLMGSLETPKKVQTAFQLAVSRIGRARGAAAGNAAVIDR